MRYLSLFLYAVSSSMLVLQWHLIFSNMTGTGSGNLPLWVYGTLGTSTQLLLISELLQWWRPAGPLRAYAIFVIVSQLLILILG